MGLSGAKACHCLSVLLRLKRAQHSIDLMKRNAHTDNRNSAGRSVCALYEIEQLTLPLPPPPHPFLFVDASSINSVYIYVAPYQLVYNKKAHKT